MRTVRQPTIKTFLLLTVVYAVVLASMTAVVRGEVVGGLVLKWPAYAGSLTAALVTWTIPFALAMVIRSPVKIAIFCAAIGCGSAAAIWSVMEKRYIGELLFEAVQSGKISLNQLVTTLLALQGTTPISCWIIRNLPEANRESPYLYIGLIISAFGYGLTSYFITKTFRLRELPE